MLKIGASILVLIALIGVFLIFSIQQLQIYQLGLDYDLVCQSISKNTLGAGRYFLLPTHKLVKFPAIYQTIDFFGRNELRTRTLDGLEVSLEISFQYMLQPQKLYDMYMKFGSGYDKVFTSLAQDSLTAKATKFTAFDIFVNPAKVRDGMEQDLKELFASAAFTDISYFQLQTVNLPKEFEQAVQDTEVSRQGIITATADQKRAMVELQTKVQQAKRAARVVVIQAEAAAQQLLTQNKANALAYTMVQDAQISKYSELQNELPESNQMNALFRYMKIRALRKHEGPIVASLDGVQQVLG